jgi:hypothetical protein
MTGMENDYDQQFVSIVRAKDLGGKIQLLCSDDHGLLSLYLDYKYFADLTCIVCQRRMQLKGTLIRFNGQEVQVALPRPSVSKLAFLHSIGLPQLPRGIFGRRTTRHANPGSGRQIIR